MCADAPIRPYLWPLTCTSVGPRPSSNGRLLRSGVSRDADKVLVGVEVVRALACRQRQGSRGARARLDFAGVRVAS